MHAIVTDTARIAAARPSVCSSHSAATRRCGGFAAVDPPGRRLIDLSLHGRHSAANTSSVNADSWRRRLDRRLVYATVVVIIYMK